MPDIKPDISTLQVAPATPNEQQEISRTQTANSTGGTIHIKSMLELCAPTIQVNHSVTNAQSAPTAVPREADETVLTPSATEQTAIRVKTEPGLELISAIPAVDNSARTSDIVEHNSALELQTCTPALDNNARQNDVVEYNADNVKLEPVVNTNSTEDEEIPATEERSAPLAIECVSPTDISADFFSDLIDLPEQPAPLETLPMEDLERKYAETLREAVLLDEMAQQRQKRASNRTNANETAEKRARLTDEAVNTTLPVLRVKTEFRTESDVQCLPVETAPANAKSNENIDIKCIANCNEIEDFDDSAKTKRDIAYRRVNFVLDLFKKETTAPVQLIHTDTVRKLPTHTQYMSQQFYDNRSPLHSANNVQFSFNSPYTNIKMEDWGLEALDTKIARIARIIGCDAYMLNWKRMVTKRPYLKQNNNTADEQKQSATASTFFSNIMTQTDITGPVCKQPTKVKTATVTTQTDPMQKSTSFLACVQNFPYLKQLSELNANQLLALNDFAELMHQDDIAADVYRLRECLLRIFQRSQMPALDHRPVYAATTPMPMPTYISLQSRNSDSTPPPAPKISDFVEHYNMPQSHQIPHSHQMPQSHQIPRPHQLYNVPQTQQTRNIHKSDPRKRQQWFQQVAQPNNQRHFPQQNPSTGNRHHPY